MWQHNQALQHLQLYVMAVPTFTVGFSSWSLRTLKMGTELGHKYELKSFEL